MDITTLSSLVSLCEKESGHTIDDDDAKLTEEAFKSLLEKLFNKISLFKKWQRVSTPDSQNIPSDEGDQVMNFFLGKILLKFYNLTLDFFKNIQDLTFFGVNQLAQKLATQFGAGDTLLSFWKFWMFLYHEHGKVL